MRTFAATLVVIALLGVTGVFAQSAVKRNFETEIAAAIESAKTRPLQPHRFADISLVVPAQLAA